MFVALAVGLKHATRPPVAHGAGAPTRPHHHLAPASARAQPPDVNVSVGAGRPVGPTSVWATSKVAGPFVVMAEASRAPADPTGLATRHQPAQQLSRGPGAHATNSVGPHAASSVGTRAPMAVREVMAPALEQADLLAPGEPTDAGGCVPLLSLGGPASVTTARALHAADTYRSGLASSVHGLGSQGAARSLQARQHPVWRS